MHKELYEVWLNSPIFDEQTKKELQELKENEQEIKERFYKNLEFGTGGLRGVIGAGINRMNIYTVRRSSFGIAKYILKNPIEGKEGVVIAHDSRRFSREFAIESALVFAACGIKAYIFDSLRSTPLLSFSILQLNCIAGAIITASHNPKEYNGYKAYWAHGGQITPPQDYEIISEINNITDFAEIKTMDYNDAIQKGLLTILGSEIDKAYLDAISTESSHLNGKIDGLKIVYTPLNGAGAIPVVNALKNLGFSEVYPVKEQFEPDENFTTAPYPNPEEVSTFDYALKLAKEKEADIIIATDPDADRTGVMVKDGNGEYQLLSGNQVGALFAEYNLSSLKEKNQLPANAAIISTIVSTRLTKEITKAYNVAYFDVLTGFKYIGEKISNWKINGEYSFICGFEESIGFLNGKYARDKDGIAAAALICEIAAINKQKGKSLLDALEDLYKKYGYFKEGVRSITLKGIEGAAQISEIMQNLRNNKPSTIGEHKIAQIKDYDLPETTGLPKSNVLYFELENNAWFCIRPSGTEPKIKIYFGVSASSSAEATKKLETLANEVMDYLSI